MVRFTDNCKGTNLGASIFRTYIRIFLNVYYGIVLRAKRGEAMTKHLETLLESAKKVVLTPEEKEQQRRSFAYGNTKIENPRITREMVDRAADALGKPKGDSTRRSE